MSDAVPDATWPAVIARAATATGRPFPQMADRGMGSVIWRKGDRFVSFRPSLGTRSTPANGDARWSLWYEKNDRPCRVLVFRVQLRPTLELVPRVFAVLQGWLSEGWSDESTSQNIAAFARVEVPAAAPVAVANEYWLTEDGAFGIVVESDGWSIRAGDRSLSTWKSKVDDNRTQLLGLDELDRLCNWLAHNWYAVAYGKSTRPPRLRDREVAACRAFDDARIDATPAELDELQRWWAMHAFRAADVDLPNIFLEPPGRRFARFLG